MCPICSQWDLYAICLCPYGGAFITGLINDLKVILVPAISKDSEFALQLTDWRIVSILKHDNSFSGTVQSLQSNRLLKIFVVVERC
jgi:hypothetical protein